MSNINKTKKFQFKQFSISDDQVGMPVSTDGVLFGAWVELEEKGLVIDIGSGTALLTLMCAQRYPHAHFVAVDMNDAAIRAGEKNIANSPWSDRVTSVHSDIMVFESNQRFDNIICNPPYFNSGEVSLNSNRAMARHTHTLTHQNLLDKSALLLHPTGKAHFILPITESKAFIDHAKSTGWFLSRYCEVKPSEKKSIHRVMLTLQKQPCSLKAESLTILVNNQYSKKFIALTKNFYLKL